MTDKPKTNSILIIGGKLFGMTVAIEVKKKHPDWDVTIVEKEAFLYKNPEIILDKSATLTSTKTIHSGTYYTHRGHSRGTDPEEQERLYNLFTDTRAGFYDVLEFLKEYDIEVSERDSKCIYMCFKNAFIEPDHFERISKEHGFYVEAVKPEEFQRLKTICTSYESEDGSPLELHGAFYTNDALVDFVQLMRNMEEKADHLGVKLMDFAEPVGINKKEVAISQKGAKKTVHADVIVNTTGAFLGPVAKVLTAEQPPAGIYILQYRNIGWIDKKAATVFERIATDKLSFFRFFQQKSKITFAEVMGDRSKICFYAPPLIPLESVMHPEDAFKHDPKKDPLLLETARKYKIDINDSSFHAYSGLSAYTKNGRDLYHQTQTKDGVPVLNCLLEKMTSFVTASKRVNHWVEEKITGERIS